MRAAVSPAFGGPEVVEVDEVEPRVLGPGQVRVAVEAAAVNYPGRVDADAPSRRSA